MNEARECSGQPVRVREKGVKRERGSWGREAGRRGESEGERRRERENMNVLEAPDFAIISVTPYN